MIALKTSYRMPAQASLAPFGTWWSVVTLTSRMEPRDGRAEVKVGVKIEITWNADVTSWRNVEAEVESACVVVSC